MPVWLATPAPEVPVVTPFEVLAPALPEGLPLLVPVDAAVLESCLILALAVLNSAVLCIVRRAVYTQPMRSVFAEDEASVVSKEKKRDKRSHILMTFDDLDKVVLVWAESV